MRHFKRFKNWVVVFYYACWAYREQFQHRNDHTQLDLVALDEPVAELEATVAAQQAAQQAEDGEVTAQQNQAALEMLDAIAQGTSGNVVPVVDSEPVAPLVEVKKKSELVPQKPVEVSPSPVQESKPKAQPSPAVVSASVKQRGTNGSSTPQATNGKYQPGAINDQTAQRLARLLVSEIKLYHKSKTDGEDANQVINIYDMLKEPIDKSRQHYKQRMGKTAIETMPDYFHGELVRSLCEGDASRLGPNYPTEKSA